MASVFIPEDILIALKEKKKGTVRCLQKILFTDLDGTLLNSAQKSFARYAAAAFQNGASRQPSGTHLRSCPAKCFKGCEKCRSAFPDTVIIAANGNEVYDCDTKTFLMRKSVPIEIARDILSMAQEENLYLHSYSDTCVGFPPKTAPK